MTSAAFLSDYLDHFVATLRQPELTSWLETAHEYVLGARESGAKIMFAGNGASASIASHYALDFTKQAQVRSMCFNDAAFLTAYANDFGYERWVAKAIEHHGSSGDLAVLISTSGRSPNIVEAVNACRERGIKAISLTGFAPDNPVKVASDLGLWADSKAYNVVEAVHAAWLGMLCDLVIGAREYSVS